MQMKVEEHSLTDKERLGLVMENFVKAELSSLGIQNVKHTGKETYGHADNQSKRGVDFKVYGEHGQLAIALETKNWKTLRRKYSTDIAQTEVIDRFENLNARLKVLVISSLDVFDIQAQKLIKSHGIDVFETEKLIGSKIFRSREFFVLKTRLNQFFEQIEINLEQRQKRAQQLISQYLQTRSENSFRCCLNIEDSIDYSIPLSLTTLLTETYDTPLETITKESIELIEESEIPVSEIELLIEDSNISFD